MKRRDLRGRVVAITGAASGIGRATAIEFAGRGCRLAISDVDEDGLTETAKQVRRCGVEVSESAVDVGDREQVDAWASEVEATHGGADILINNAGVTVVASVEEHSLEDFEWLMQINFWGVVYGCRAFLPQLRERPWGHIVNISSTFGLIGAPMQSSYCAAKFAVRGFTESLSAELSDSAIGVTVVHPGGVKTQIATNARGGQAHADLHRDVMKYFERKATEPDRVGMAIADAVVRDRRRLVVAHGAHAIDLAGRLFPGAAGRFIARLGARRRTS